MLRETPKVDTKKTALVRKLPLLVLAAGISFFVLALGALIMRDETSIVECAEKYKNDGKITTLSADLTYQIADTPGEQTKGLSGKECLPTDQAVLFVFDTPAKRGFWMKDMKFPIDIVWLDAERNVISVDSGVSPNTYPKVFYPDEPAKYVLELKSGQAANLGITVDRSISW